MYVPTPCRAAGLGYAERCARLRAQAGLLIAETEFALQVESDIAPYKGLLMGLFFMTVGMEISAGLFFAKLRTVLAAIAVLLIGKVRAFCLPACSSLVTRCRAVLQCWLHVPVLLARSLLPCAQCCGAGNWEKNLCRPPLHVHAMACCEI